MPSTPQYEADYEAESLLNVLDPLSYPQRMRELATLVRDMRHPMRPVLEALEARGPYERGIAIVAASVARDAEWIAARVADPDPYIRGHALRVADSLQIPDSVYESAPADAPEATRRGPLRRPRGRHRRTGGDGAAAQRAGLGARGGTRGARPGPACAVHRGRRTAPRPHRRRRRPGPRLLVRHPVPPEPARRRCAARARGKRATGVGELGAAHPGADLRQHRRRRSRAPRPHTAPRPGTPGVRGRSRGPAARDPPPDRPRRPRTGPARRGPHQRPRRPHGLARPLAEHLRLLRRHALPDVRDAALAVVTAHE